MSRRHTVSIGLILTFLLITGTASYILYHEFRRTNLRVAFLDIGQGDSIFIEAPNGVQFLVDGGPGNTVVTELSAVLPFYDRFIDVLLATHPDSDHVGGISNIVKRFRIGKFIRTDVVASSTMYRDVLQQIDTHNIPTIIAKRGQRFVLDDTAGVYVDVLFPDRSVSNLETNTSSIVVAVRYKKINILLTGDSPKGVERFLSETFLENATTTFHAHILKLGHHGSHTSSDELFLKTTHPDLAVISAGKNNRYGHPHKDVIERLENLGIPYTTPLDGRRVFESDGISIWPVK